MKDYSYYKNLGYSIYKSSRVFFYLGYRGQQIASPINFGEFEEQCEKHLKQLIINRSNKLNKIK